MPYKINPFTGDLNYYKDGGVYITSYPESDEYRVGNIVYDSETSKIMVHYDDTPGGDAASIPSNPDIGDHQVVNIYYDASTEKVMAWYDDAPN